ncbi:MAG: hypothetical protein ACE5I3_14065 [Phycisphaerae bacterium]
MQSFERGAAAPGERWGVDLDAKQLQRWLEALGRSVVQVRQEEVRAFEQGRRPASPDLLWRFQQEAQVLGRLQHPGIAQVFEAGTFGDEGAQRPFFAMEYVSGRPLSGPARLKSLELRARPPAGWETTQSGSAPGFARSAHDRGLFSFFLRRQSLLEQDRFQRVKRAGESARHA